ncbi:MAG TPA: hypothetical protein VNO55_31625 [Polyangia bacterium]|nr:hypothetical protein [Polyangia bacterium]
MSSVLKRLQRKQAEQAEREALKRAMARLTPEEQRLLVECWARAGQQTGCTPAHMAAVKRLSVLVREEKARGLH